MNDHDLLGYVTAAAAVMGIAIDEARARRVATHLARTAALAAQLDAYPLDVADEPAEIYRPSAFQIPVPPAGQGRERP